MHCKQFYFDERDESFISFAYAKYKFYIRKGTFVTLL